VLAAAVRIAGLLWRPLHTSTEGVENTSITGIGAHPVWGRQVGTFNHVDLSAPVFQREGPLPLLLCAILLPILAAVVLEEVAGNVEISVA
jgi:hypothetical protein